MHAYLTAVSASVLGMIVSLTAAQTCYSGVNVFTARGTGEVPATGLGIEGVHINAILAAIPDSNVTVVDYPASFANNSIAIGVQNGTSELQAYLDECPTSKVVIMGYSQGALVQGYVLTGVSLGIEPDGTAGNYTVPPLTSKYADQIVAIVFFGDPFFNINIGINSDEPYPCNVSSGAPRTGALWESYGSRLEEWCNYSDFVCCSTGTTFDGHISYFSGGNATITADFVSGKYNASISGGSPSVSSSTPLSTSRPSGTAVSRSSVSRAVPTSGSPPPGSGISTATRPASIVLPPSSTPAKVSSGPGTSLSRSVVVPPKSSGTAPGTGSGSGSTPTTTKASPTTSPANGLPPFPTFAFPTLPTFALPTFPAFTLPAFKLPTGFPALAK